MVASILLGGRPEFARADPKRAGCMDNLEDKSEVAAIDRKTHQFVARWPIAPGESPSGRAIDVKNHRLFLGCHNKTDGDDGQHGRKIIDAVPIGQGVDAEAFDPETRLAFARAAMAP